MSAEGWRSGDGAARIEELSSGTLEAVFGILIFRFLLPKPAAVALTIVQPRVNCLGAICHGRLRTSEPETPRSSGGAAYCSRDLHSPSTNPQNVDGAMLSRETEHRAECETALHVRVVDREGGESGRDCGTYLTKT